MSSPDTPVVMSEIKTSELISFTKNSAVKSWIRQMQNRIHDTCQVKVNKNHYCSVIRLLQYLSTNDVGLSIEMLEAINEGIGKKLFTTSLINQLQLSQQNWQFFKVICVCLSYNFKISDLISGINKSNTPDTQDQHDIEKEILDPKKPDTTPIIEPDGRQNVDTRARAVINLKNAVEVVPITPSQTAFLQFLNTIEDKLMNGRITYGDKLAQIFLKYRGNQVENFKPWERFKTLAEQYNTSLGSQTGSQIPANPGKIARMFGSDTITFEEFYDELKGLLARTGDKQDTHESHTNIFNRLPNDIYRGLTLDFLKNNLDTLLYAINEDGIEVPNTRTTWRDIFEQANTQNGVRGTGGAWGYLEKIHETYQHNNQMRIISGRKNTWKTILDPHRIITGLNANESLWNKYYQRLF